MTRHVADAYRWGEEGIAGFVTSWNPMFSALWNGKDAILKERLFGLTNNQGSWRRCKRTLFHQVSSPTHSIANTYTNILKVNSHGELESKQAKQRRTRIWNIRYAIFDKMLILIVLSNMQKQIPMISWWKLLLLTEAVQPPKFTCCRSYGFVTFEAQ
jgi:hypothetical protein